MDPKLRAKNIRLALLLAVGAVAFYLWGVLG